MIQTPKFFSMSKNLLFSTLTSFVATVALGSSLFGISTLTQAQTAPENFGLADWQFTPAQGAAAPLFRSTTDTTVKILNLKTNDIVVPSDGQFKCKFEIRSFQPKSSTVAWTLIADNVAYSAANGCTSTITKAIRGSGLNWSLKVTVTNIADTTKTYEFNNSYAYTFQGAGTASGN